MYMLHCFVAISSKIETYYPSKIETYSPAENLLKPEGKQLEIALGNTGN